VSKEAQSLIAAITVREKELLSRIDQLGNAKLKSLREQRELVTIFKADTERSNDFTRQVISEGRTVDILSLKAPLVARLSDCKSHVVPLDPSEEASIRLSFDMSRIVKTVKSAGSITI